MTAAAASNSSAAAAPVMPMTHGHTRDPRAALGLALIHAGALGAFVPAFFSWPAVATCLVLHVVGSLGIAFGYHRYLSHRSFTLREPLGYIAAFVGGIAFQGGPIDWIATHRAHHAHTDRSGDPHNASRGMAWSHVTWIFRTNPARVERASVVRWAPDIARDRVYRLLEQFHLPIQLALAAALFACGGWPFVVWGTFVRLVLTYHGTWIVNSAAHGRGYRSFATDDRSTNNTLVSLLTLGEGWHNNHHAFPASAKHGFKRHEIDPAYGIVSLLARLRLAGDVVLPSPEAIGRHAHRRDA